MDRPMKNTMNNATIIFAPDEIPSTKGPAIGLWKKVCNKYPARASAPPRINAASVRGIRMSHRILAFNTSCPRMEERISLNGMDTVPMQTFRIRNRIIPAVSKRNAVITLNVRLCCIYFLPYFSRKRYFICGSFPRRSMICKSFIRSPMDIDC